MWKIKKQPREDEEDSTIMRKQEKYKLDESCSETNQCKTCTDED